MAMDMYSYDICKVHIIRVYIYTEKTLYGIPEKILIHNHACPVMHQ